MNKGYIYQFKDVFCVLLHTDFVQDCIAHKLKLHINIIQFEIRVLKQNAVISSKYTSMVFKGIAS